MKLRGQLKLVFFMFGMLAAIAPNARAGGVTGGGGAVGGIPLSHAENEGSDLITDFDQLQGFDLVREIFGKIEESVPGFLPDLKAGLTKDWYLEPKPFDEKECRDQGSVTILDSRIVACQTPFEVRIGKKWFEEEAGRRRDAAGNQTDADLERRRRLARAQIILHELNRSIYLVSMKWPNPITDQAVHVLDRLLFRIPFPQPQVLQAKLKELGYGGYFTKDQVREKQASFEREYGHLAKEFLLAEELTGRMISLKSGEEYARAYEELKQLIRRLRDYEEASPTEYRYIDQVILSAYSELSLPRRCSAKLTHLRSHRMTQIQGA